MLLNVQSPETVYIQFIDSLPSYFELKDSNTGVPYYFRYLDGRTPRIRFNVVDSGQYETNHSFKIVRTSRIYTPTYLSGLPAPDRNRYKNVEVALNTELEGTPARIFTDTGAIEVDNKFLSYPLPFQKFLLYHELAHLFYSSEENCDLFALVAMLRLGYNRSMSFYTMSNCLSRSVENIQRMERILNQIQFTQETKL